MVQNGDFQGTVANASQTVRAFNEPKGNGNRRGPGKNSQAERKGAPEIKAQGLATMSKFEQFVSQQNTQAWIIATNSRACLVAILKCKRACTHSRAMRKPWGGVEKWRDEPPASKGAHKQDTFGCPWRDASFSPSTAYPQKTTETTLYNRTWPDTNEPLCGDAKVKLTSIAAQKNG